MSALLPITKDEAIAIHDASLQRFGGSPGLRDEGLLDSALAQPWQTFAGNDLYSGDVSKACRLAYGIIRDHPFADGNKRTGAALLGTTLRMAGYDFHPDSGEFLRTMLSLADGTMDYEGLLAWTKDVIG